MAATRAVLRAHGIRPSRRWGQHFLVSGHVLRLLLDAAALEPGDTVLEVGAGIGTLTVALAQRARRVLAVEVDRQLLPALRSATAPYPHVTVVEGDILRLDLPALLVEAREGTPKAVANLPYNIASPVLLRLLDPQTGLRRVVVMVQREVAERIVAGPGTPSYGRLSLAVRYRGTPQVVARVRPGAFLPPPEVESAIVVVVPHGTPPVRVSDEEELFRVISSGFAHRRKVLSNALSHALGLAAEVVETACREAGVDPRARAETLSLEQFAALTEALHPLPPGRPRANRRDGRGGSR